MQILKKGCDLVLEMGVSEESCCRSLDELECLTEIGNIVIGSFSQK